MMCVKVPRKPEYDDGKLYHVLVLLHAQFLAQKGEFRGLRLWVERMAQSAQKLT